MRSVLVPPHFRVRVPTEKVQEKNVFRVNFGRLKEQIYVLKYIVHLHDNFYDTIFNSHTDGQMLGEIRNFNEGRGFRSVGFRQQCRMKTVCSVDFFFFHGSTCTALPCRGS